MIMRVDNIITCAPRQREAPRMHWFLLCKLYCFYYFHLFHYFYPFCYLLICLSYLSILSITYLFVYLFIFLFVYPFFLLFSYLFLCDNSRHPIFVTCGIFDRFFVVVMKVNFYKGFDFICYKRFRFKYMDQET